MAFKQLVIGIDLDSTVCDLLSEWLRLYNETHTENVKVADIKTWELEDNVSKGKEVYRHLGDPDLYRRLVEYPNSIEVLKGWHDAGHELHILTSPSRPPHTAADKLHWCHEKLPFIPFDRLGLIHHKHRFLVDVFIDDSPHNLRKHASMQPNAHRLGIAFPYNEEVSNIMHVRAPSFEDPGAAWKAFDAYVRKLSESK